jgi:hypothetical protein
VRCTALRHFEQQIVGIVVLPRPSDALNQVVLLTEQNQTLVVLRFNARVAERGVSRRGTPLGPPFRQTAAEVPSAEEWTPSAAKRTSAFWPLTAIFRPDVALADLLAKHPERNMDDVKGFPTTMGAPARLQVAPEGPPHTNSAPP